MRAFIPYESFGTVKFHFSPYRRRLQKASAKNMDSSKRIINGNIFQVTTAIFSIIWAFKIVNILQ